MLCMSKQMLYNYNDAHSLSIPMLLDKSNQINNDIFIQDTFVHTWNNEEVLITFTLGNPILNAAWVGKLVIEKIIDCAEGVA